LKEKKDVDMSVIAFPQVASPFLPLVFYLLPGWPQYSNLTQKDFVKMKKSLVIDSRRILSGKKFDIDYNALGVTR